MNTLNHVETSVSIAGKPVHFVSLSLKQAFNKHHHFEITVNFEELDIKWMENPTRIIKLIGSIVDIEMRHRVTQENNLFRGVITNISMVGRHGEQNNIVITGCSPTIRLDGKKTMDSFMDKTLDLVAKESIANSGNGAEVTVKPSFKGQLEYICQYNETAFEFLNRLSWLYGEWFFYDGINTHFGKPDSNDEVDLIYDIDITHFNMTAGLTPAKFSRYEYLINTDVEIETFAPESVNGVRGYVKAALDKSVEFYTSDADLPSEPLIKSKQDLDSIVEVEKTRAIANMLVMSGNAKTCKVSIGKVVNVKLPMTMGVTVKDVESFLITEVTHTVDQKGYYSNAFKGIPAGLAYIPMTPVQPPKTSSQMATVFDNSDSKGRIKVQLQWQKKKNKSTNWIRVQTPDAGGGGDKVASNRGLVTIPEIGDTVMVGFEYSDPNRPFSMGSIFLQKHGTGGGAGNNILSLTAKSGHTLKMDDGGGMSLIDKTKLNHIEIDGNNKITITADNHIVLTNNKCTIEILDSQISISAPSKISLTSDTVEINATSKMAINGKDGGNTTTIDINGQTTTIIGSTKATIKKDASSSIEMKGDTAVKGKKVFITGEPVNIN